MDDPLTTDGRKQIWLPKSEMHVTVKEGKVTMTETMTMASYPIKHPIGFNERPT